MLQLQKQIEGLRQTRLGEEERVRTMVMKLRDAINAGVENERQQRLLMEEKLIELLEATCLKVEEGLL